MAEQFINLYDSTLNGGYTAGSGTMVVTSASGLPTSGTYSLIVRDQTTKAIKLIFRVASRSGTTLSGAAEGSDVNAASGDLVSGGIATAASMSQALNDRVAQRIPPVSANFSWVNQDSATEQHDDYGFSLSVPPHSNNNLTHRVVSVTKPYTYIVGFSGICGNPTYSQFGASIRDSVANKSIVVRFGQTGGATPDIYYWTDPASYSSQVFNAGVIQWGASPVFFKIVNNNTNRTYYMASERAAMRGHWFQLYQEAYNAWMSNDDQAGVFGLSNQATFSTMIDVVHFSVT